MATKRQSKSRFSAEEDLSPRTQDVAVDKVSKDLGLSYVDSSYAIGQSGGVVVVMQEFHDESAFDTGDFAVSKSRFDRRKDAQKDRADAVRRQKEEERRAAIAQKKEEEERAAREAESARRAAKKAADEERKKKEREEREAAKKAAVKKEVPAPPPPVPEKAKLSDGSKAILKDSAIVGIGNVIKKTASSLPVAVSVSVSVQTDPVRILPMVDSASAATASAAWWLQQGHSSAGVAPPTVVAPVSQAPPPVTSNSDQFMMQAYIDAMQRQQSSNYGYWTTPQSSAADLYWQQQQQGVYQSTPSQRYATAPRRV